jgi:two-component system, NtrC family, response regulator AtoC
VLQIAVRAWNRGGGRDASHSPEQSFSRRPVVQRRILLAEPSESHARRIRSALESDAQLCVQTVREGHAALQSLNERQYSILLADMHLPGKDASRLLHTIQEHGLPVSVVVMAEDGSVDEAVEVMRQGAYDYLNKPVEAQHLRLVIQRVLRERRLQDEVIYLREQLQERYSFHEILSKSPRMHAVFELISNVAQSNTTVLIEGETGTGKEVVARAIHNASHLRSGPMVAVNCAAVPETLLESELFGHEKGAFTGALSQRHGRFELANGGTIFLDEVGDIPAAMQAKLLRVLQERRFERVGGAESIEVDVRVIAATNRSLLRLVQEGKFREDLYYRLNVIKIDLPPLRERKEDIPLLAAHFAEKYARTGESGKQIPPKSMQSLLHYNWPGNVRELENAIERACVTSLNGSIQPDHLPGEVVAGKAVKTPFAVDLEQSLPQLLRHVCAEVEQDYIRQALEKSGGVVSRCAKMCGLSRRSLSAKLTAYQIDKTYFKNVMDDQ